MKFGLWSPASLVKAEAEEVLKNALAQAGEWRHRKL